MLQKAHYLVFQIFPISRAPEIGKLDSSHSSFQLQPKKGNTAVADLSNHLCTEHREQADDKTVDFAADE